MIDRNTASDDSGTQEREKFGPLGRVELVKDLQSGNTTLVAKGTSVIARSWTSKRYDEGRPAGDNAVTSNQITSTNEGAQVREHPAVMADAQLTTVGYDWAKGLPTQVVQDPAGLAITTTQYDDQGRVAKQGAPGTTGTDAGTQLNRPGFDGDIEDPEGCRPWLLPVSAPPGRPPQHRRRPTASRTRHRPPHQSVPDGMINDFAGALARG
ncbi:hypothetical protein [Streptomyces sp. KMM 9044]|uniref:hypothetical protein n=1 Tax=Streptomyces sp. KMM 9044 TaxID=2744474 RepID=UPI002150CDB7|nr:hypothetical protein [Streptomyces sp. KMM 9044]WAX80192.1 hypothetical protein HUV60_023555 [Streptomyces sp. KMM 9044]